MTAITLTVELEHTDRVWSAGLLTLVANLKAKYTTFSVTWEGPHDARFSFTHDRASGHGSVTVDARRVVVKLEAEVDVPFWCPTSVAENKIRDGILEELRRAFA